MCKLLGISRANVYKYKRPTENRDSEEKHIKRIFRDNRQAYGTRRIKAACGKEGIVISRRRIARIMRDNGLVSVYTRAQFKVHKQVCNDSLVGNNLNRQFDIKNLLDTIVSDLTYVRVDGKWHYICNIIDLHNREIIGYSCGKHKTANLVHTAFAIIKEPLYKIKLFHTDRGREFMNKALDELLETFDIKRSLSHKGTPYDNAVAEATFKSIKTEFVYPSRFDSLEQLIREFSGYVWWFNNQRLHSSLNYQSPTYYKNDKIRYTL